MSVHDELFAAVATIRQRTGDPNAWMAGLTPDEVIAVIDAKTGPQQLGTILSKIRQQHPDLFAPPPAAPPPVPQPSDHPPETPPDGEQGAAAEAIARAEAALAQQNSASSQLDMQVITAILNAHLKATEGREALTKLQRETEAAVAARSDLDTPAGARDFQRFLIGKLRDIRAVVLNASLDDTSKSALMAAWTSLYDASRNKPVSDDQPPTASVPAGASTDDDWDAGWDPLLDSVAADDPGEAPPDAPVSGPPQSAPPPLPAAPMMPTGMPAGFGAPPMPALGTASGPGLGLPLPTLQDGGGQSGPPRGDSDDAALVGPDDEDANAPAPPDDPNDADGDGDEQQAKDASPPEGPTTVILPDGETLTAATPQLGAAIKAAVAGVPIADAFRQQGITIPAPGTAVTEPVDPARLAPGDVGIFTDRHALALSAGKALVDGQIQHTATVSGPSFLGWEHPPVPTAAKPDPPAPTRPASAPTTAQ